MQPAGDPPGRAGPGGSGQEHRPAWAPLPFCSRCSPVQQPPTPHHHPKSCNRLLRSPPAADRPYVAPPAPSSPSPPVLLWGVAEEGTGGGGGRQLCASLEGPGGRLRACPCRPFPCCWPGSPGTCSPFTHTHARPAPSPPSFPCWFQGGKQTFSDCNSPYAFLII